MCVAEAEAASATIHTMLCPQSRTSNCVRPHQEWVIYRPLWEGKLDFLKHLARRVRDLYFNLPERGIRSRTIWSSLQCVHECVQGKRSRPATQGHNESHSALAGISFPPRYRLGTTREGNNAPCPVSDAKTKRYRSDVIGSGPGGRSLELPFCSHVNLRQASRRLQAFGTSNLIRYTYCFRTRRIKMQHDRPDFPTMEQVEKANHEQLARWYRFLPSGDTKEQQKIMDRIAE